MSREAAMALATGEPIKTSTPAGEPGIIPSPEPTAGEPARLDSEKFAALARRETDFVKKQQLLKAEREAFDKERDALKPVVEQYRQYQDTKAKDPVAALKLMGFSETDIINFLAAEEKPEPTPEERAVAAAKAATDAAIKEFNEAQAKKTRDEQTARDNAAIKGFESQLGKVIEGNKEKFEYCAYWGEAAQELAMEFTRKVVIDSKGADILTAEEAVQAVEDYYEEQDKAMNAIKKRGGTDTAKKELEMNLAKTERTRTITPGNPSVEPPKPPIQRDRTPMNGISPGISSARQKMHETKDEKRDRLINWLRTGVKH